jgi:hypothetical protein
MSARVPVTFFTADAASQGASLKGAANRLLVRARAARSDRTGRDTDICAIQVQSNTLRQFFDHVFAQAGIRATGAGLRAGIALLDAANERFIHVAFDVGMRADNFPYLHCRLLVVDGSNRTGNRPPFLQPLGHSPRRARRPTTARVPVRARGWLSEAPLLLLCTCNRRAAPHAPTKSMGSD